MAKGDIRVSEKHGVNPSLELCFWCGKPRGVVLFGRMKGDAEAPRECVADHEPCDFCKEMRAKGLTLIEVKEGTQEKPEPTGRWCVVTEDFVRRVFSSEAAEQIVRERVAHIEPLISEHFGLFTEEANATAVYPQ